MIRNGSRIYLDTNIFIYHLENVAIWSDLTGLLFRRIDRGELSAVSSELALAECLVRPFAKRDEREIEAFQDFIRERNNLRIAPVTREILIESARVRAETAMRMKLFDSIHLATAKVLECDFLVTNDHRFDAAAGIQIQLLADTESGGA